MNRHQLYVAFSGTPDAPGWHCVQATPNSISGPRQAAFLSKSPLKVTCLVPKSWHCQAAGMHSSIRVFGDVEEGQCTQMFSMFKTNMQGSRVQFSLFVPVRREDIPPVIQCQNVRCKQNKAVVFTYVMLIIVAAVLFDLACEVDVF